MTTENTTQNQIETLANLYIEENRETIERSIKRAGYEGYGAGLNAAQRIYRPEAP